MSCIRTTSKGLGKFDGLILHRSLPGGLLVCCVYVQDLPLPDTSNTLWVFVWNIVDTNRGF
jgi:hypothetical protein